MTKVGIQQGKNSIVANRTLINLRKTKIVATIGPASDSYEGILGLAEAGVDVFRLNMSHSSASDLERIVGHIRCAEDVTERNIAIMVDLQGPKLRVGRFVGNGAGLKKGLLIRLDLSSNLCSTERIGIRGLGDFSGIDIGQVVLLDDGRIELEIVDVLDDCLTCRIRRGGHLSNNKGVNFPGVVLPVSALTEQDKENTVAAIDVGIDWIALSFVQTADDVMGLRSLVKDSASILAKIERPSAYEQIQEILNCSDGVMVARGDLGVELPVEDVPVAQKRIVDLARRSGKPVVVATQMLESMIQSSVPTRAEVSDVANAVFEGADAVMLSGETAVGENPVAVVQVIDKVAIRSEQALSKDASKTRWRKTTGGSADMISMAASQAVDMDEGVAIVTFTASGSTASPRRAKKAACAYPCTYAQASGCPKTGHVLGSAVDQHRRRREF